MTQNNLNFGMAVSAIAIILIFQLIDMLSMGPALFYTTSGPQWFNTLGQDDIRVLKTLGTLVYSYSAMISMISFGIATNINATIVAGPIVESFRPMINSYSKAILNETQTVDGFFTNFCIHLLITTIGFALVSIAIYSFDIASYLNYVPKSVINGCICAIAFGQLSIGLDCLRGRSKTLSDVSILVAVAVFCVILYYIIDLWVGPFDFLVPIYSLCLILTFYLASLGYYRNSTGLMEQLRNSEWINRTQPITWPNFIIKQFDPKLISFKALYKNIFNIFAMIAISMIHIIVNLPAFKISTGKDVDFSREVAAQGFSNIFTLIPSYFVVSYSIAAFRSGGSSKYLSIIAGVLMSFLAIFGVVINGVTPKFVLSLIPGIMFVFFLQISFYETLYTASIFEYLLSVIIFIIIKKSGHYIVGMIVGFSLYVILFSCFALHSYLTARNLELRKNEPQIIENSRIGVIKIGKILWFESASRFIADLSKIENCKTVILDCRDCAAIDWTCQDLIAHACEKYQNVIILGHPLNFKLSRFDKIPNFALYPTYTDFCGSQ